ncbi:uncharacterized conserved protein [Hahella chejuensis KCTC 2396]|uniref:Uncharacterized conserved protein n=1 Tax=Hahella chejuensis (strain KCTC 2396) TaxID=349521 RepID=Q2SBD0_HAHCH|nr:saccharopine dehydrogenase NADP-binding domain-containing protein [Hahella chejuensis]ABC32044.1 uncharacterized conserved protein [Hahella chejuensis KCTC 2396]
MANKKIYDLVLFGATGYTGELTAEYLARAMMREDFVWAIAGRNPEKLERLKKRLCSINPDVRSRLHVIQADIEDQASLDTMAKDAKAVINTVGPYIKFGEPVIKACVTQGADYADLTGEPEFVDAMISQYDEVAKRNKVRIVNCCGFDSIPHDLGAYYTVTELTQGLPADALAANPVKLEGFVRAGGAFSGGTWHSAVHAFSRARQAQANKRNRPRIPESTRQVGSVDFNLRFRKEINAWACPFPTIDPQVVKRSARALEQYGQEFKYGHYVQVKKLPRVLAGAAFVGGVFALAQLKPTRNWLLSLKPAGQGPTPEQRSRGWFKVVFIGSCNGRRIKTQVSGGDPGYGETSKMLAESGLCLALDRRKLPKSYGVITPVMAMGRSLMDRLQQRGVKFEVLESAA